MKVIKPISKNYKNKNSSSVSLIRCLTECERGKEVEVISVNAGFKAKWRLANLGIVPGVKIVKKRSAPLKGPLEIIVKGSSMVIGRGIAEKIIVRCNEKCKS
ncbi:MAG: ferrous iron transport protein A [Candidatus Thorarchaeota archaeon]